MVRILQVIRTLARLTSGGQVSRVRTSDSEEKIMNIEQGVSKFEVGHSVFDIHPSLSCVLNLVSCASLISAGVVFVLCAGQWLQCASASEQIERNLGPPVVERFRRPAEGSEKSGQQTLSALVRQAEALAGTWGLRAAELLF